MTQQKPVKPISFAIRNQWRAWLRVHYKTSPGVWLKLYKKHVSRGLQYAEAVEEALCYGWIDGQLRRIDETQHMLRFSPRRQHSVWAPSNIARVKKLIREKKMTPAGLKLFRSAKLVVQTAPDSTKPRSLVLPPDLKRALMKNKIAWQHWQNRPPSAKRIAIWWVRTAKQPATRLRRIKNIVSNTAKYARAHY
jgi:uncharacterized protein YdeI (YjbR/CyaY-like superfamily)